MASLPPGLISGATLLTVDKEKSKVECMRSLEHWIFDLRLYENELKFAREIGLKKAESEILRQIEYVKKQLKLIKRD